MPGSATNVFTIYPSDQKPIQKNHPQEYVDYWGNTYNDGYDENGHSSVYGWGRVDAGAAVRAALSWSP